MDAVVLAVQQDQLCADTRCCLEDLPGVMGDRDERPERIRELRAISKT